MRYTSENYLTRSPSFILKILAIGYLKSLWAFSISKTQLDHYPRSNMLVTAKKPTFEPEVRNSAGSLQTMSERFAEVCNAVSAEVLYNFARLF